MSQTAALRSVRPAVPIIPALASIEVAYAAAPAPAASVAADPPAAAASPVEDPRGAGPGVEAPSGAGRSVDFDPTAPAHLEIDVVDQEGKPVLGAAITLVSPALPPNSPPPLHTGADGAARTLVSRPDPALPRLDAFSEPG